MSSPSSKQTVFVLGGTGTTGSSVVEGLLESGKYNVVVGVRPVSISKPEVNELRERGVEIRAIELSNAPHELDAALKGVDTVVSTTFYTEIDKQVHLADAAKRVGVKRFIPDDWASPCVRGVRRLYDEKAVIQDYIKSIGLGYTFIDVGIWAAVMLPSDKEEAEDTFMPAASHAITGAGNVKNAVTHIPDIGKFVAEIIDDDRTLNKYVFCWAEELTQNELWDIARKAKAELGGGPLNASPVYQSEEALLEKVKATEDGSWDQIGYEYIYSMFVRGDNTVENAKKPEYGGALDARELYPHLEVSSIKDAAKAIYQK
ncbi:NAD(P)-binding protein [Schizopora paradoxa]|uniref:NAD(P)-binding protein n=1 Tax=Schizopora paradoxa TaxID=27342 RepID=A0A0H2RR46_9AGAM|nr:NAD(P)-binding protein [Schizopora paradoxa]